jgi:hypothetical protein
MKHMLVVGHIDTLHSTLFVLTEGSNLKERLKDVDYIDISASSPLASNQYGRWDDVPSSSKSILYTWNCPVYSALSHIHATICDPESRKMWHDILISGHRILQEGGHLIIPISRTVSKLPWRSAEREVGDIRFQEENAEAIVDAIAPRMWTVEAVLTYPFQLVDKEQPTPTPLLVFTRHVGI